jgi:hypothetical protein
MTSNFLISEDYTKEDFEVWSVTRRSKIFGVLRFEDDIYKGMVHFHAVADFNLINI